MIYFDNAATTPLCEEAKSAMLAAMDSYANPSSVHGAGFEVSQALSEHRKTVAKTLSCHADEVIFTSCGTEADHLAIFGAVGALRRRGKRLVLTDSEHPAVEQCAKALENEGILVHRLSTKGGVLDPEEVEAIVPVMLKTPGTCYLRLGRGGEPTLHDGPVTDWQPPKALTLRQGTDVAILSAGGILTQTVSAAAILAEQGVSAEVVSFPCLKPIDRDKLIELSQRFQHIVTVEEHSIVGGFGSAVCEVIAETGATCRVHRIGMEDVYSTIVGTQQYLRGEYRMDDETICERAMAWLNG